MRTFEAWKKQVDDEMFSMFGLLTDDIPDFDYYSAYQRNINPRRVASAAWNAAKGY